MPLNLQSLGKKAKEAAFQLSQCSTEQKNRALKFIAEQIEEQSDVILSANELDMKKAKKNGTSDAILDRLLLTEDRLTAIANDVRKVISLTDPVGQIIDGSNLDNGLTLYRRKVPLGVIGVIYEARPNVTIDIASLCIKTGNAVILRGGKETIHTNEAMINVIQTALSSAALPEYSVQSINNPDRKYITELLKLDRYVDMIIPRGGSELQKLCIEQSTIPVITGGIGVCHIFVDENADFDKALSIIVNAKTQRPSTCNTVETLLIHSRIIDTFLPKFVKAMKDNQIVLHADVRAFSKLSNLIDVEKVQDEELRREWLSKDLNVILVDSLEDAVTHIREYGSSHSDAILTKNLSNAEKFVNLVNSAAVYVNASTRFTDGAQFGLGAEVAISTQKLHARGPMGLDALTTYKWIGYGDDLIRK